MLLIAMNACLRPDLFVNRLPAGQLTFGPWEEEEIQTQLSLVTSNILAKLSITRTSKPGCENIQKGIN
ncbi:unnamed protein product [Caretta caretta]